MAAIAESEIRTSLSEQLEEQSKCGRYFDDLINDYIYLWKLKKMIQKDIKKRGIRYEVTSGNGFVSEKPNESVPNLMKVTTQMLKLLSDLGLQEPVVDPGGGADDYC